MATSPRLAQYHFASLLLQLENYFGNQWHWRISIEQVLVTGEEKMISRWTGCTSTGNPDDWSYEEWHMAMAVAMTLAAKLSLPHPGRPAEWTLRPVNLPSGKTNSPLVSLGS